MAFTEPRILKFLRNKCATELPTSSLNPLRGAVATREHVDEGEIAAVVRNPAGRLQLRAPDRADAEILCEYDEGKLAPFSSTAIQVLSTNTCTANKYRIDLKGFFCKCSDIWPEEAFHKLCALALRRLTKVVARTPLSLPL